MKLTMQTQSLKLLCHLPTKIGVAICSKRINHILLIKTINQHFGLRFEVSKLWYMLQGAFDHGKSFFHTPKAWKALFERVFKVLRFDKLHFFKENQHFDLRFEVLKLWYMLQGAFDHEKSSFQTPKAWKTQLYRVFKVVITLFIYLGIYFLYCVPRSTRHGWVRRHSDICPLNFELI